MLIGQNVKNALINSRLDFWQRNITDTFGASGTTAARYVADRWRVISVPAGGTSAAMVISRQAFTPGQIEVPGNPLYYLRVTNSTVGVSLGALSNHGMDQGIEDVNTFAGKKVTVSLYARSSISGQKLSVSLNRNFGSGGSTADQITGYGSFNLTSTFQRYSFTLTLPSVSGKTIGAGSFLSLRVNFQSGSGEAGLYGGAAFPFAGTGTIDIANLMLSEGELADYEPAAKTPTEELSICRRFYETGNYLASGYNGGAGIVPLVACWYKTRKRIDPVVTTSFISGSSINSMHYNSVDGFISNFNFGGAGATFGAGTFTADAEF